MKDTWWRKEKAHLKGKGFCPGCYLIDTFPLSTLFFDIDARYDLHGDVIREQLWAIRKGLASEA